ncbi:MAG: response regulator [Deltaproteobacteria bacterium]|nr:response regulator [Deltaproteobacteria bacterium]
MNVQVIRSLVSRLGMTLGTLITTGFSIVISVLTFLLITWIFKGFNWVGFAVSVLAPAIIAPICTVILLKMTMALYEAEEKLQMAHDDLERKVAEQTRELRESNTQLREVIKKQKKAEQERNEMEALLRRAEKMEALGVLAGGVAHDLNNVLGVLVGYSELLLIELPEDSPYREHITNIHQSGQRGAAIVQDLLTMGRRGVATSEVVNLNDIVQIQLQTPECKKLCASHAEVQFRTELDPDLLNMKGSTVHLAKTAMNLVMNALEAIPERGEVLIRTENRHLDAATRGYDEVEQGDYVVLQVSDNGRGISPIDLEKIFEPFYTRKVMGRSGTGLGLTVVWGTVKDHKGHIEVQSAEGKGSTFTLLFPVTREERDAPGRKLSPEEYQGKGEFVLVVDDVEAQRKLATSMLTKLGYEAASVASGEEAVAFVRTNKPDLLVLDMIMDPGMDGLDTYRKILEIHPGQKAIIVSGFSETERVNEAQALGAGAYVRKPYIMERLGQAVRSELDRR